MQVLYIVAAVLVMTAGLVGFIWLMSHFLGKQANLDHVIPTGYEEVELATKTVELDVARRKYLIGQGWYALLAASWAYNSFTYLRDGKVLVGALFLVSLLLVSAAIIFWKREFARLRANPGLFLARRTVFNSFAAAALFFAFAGVLHYQGKGSIFLIVFGCLSLAYGFAKRDTLKQALANNKPMQGDAHEGAP